AAQPKPQPTESRAVATVPLAPTAAQVPLVRTPNLAAAFGLPAAVGVGVLTLLGLALAAVRLRHRPGGARHLASAIALPSTGLAVRGGTDLTGSVRDLQGQIHGIGKGRVTEYADAVLEVDREPMMWHDSPS